MISKEYAVVRERVVEEQVVLTKEREDDRDVREGCWSLSDQPALNYRTVCAPSPSRSTTTSQRNALRVIFAPVSLSVERVELFRSIGLAGTGGGRGDVERYLELPMDL